MNPTPRLSVIVPWRNREELQETLAANGDAFADADAEVVVVACGGDQAWLARALLDVRHPSVSTRLVAFEHEVFNKSLAVNLGVSHAASDSLMVLDGDIFLDADTLPVMLDAISTKSYVTVANVVETRPVEIEAGSMVGLGFHVTIKLDDGRACTIETSMRNVQTGARSGPGLLMIDRSHFLHIDGMNSELQGWGWEDVDLLVRAELEAGLERRSVGSVRHRSHESQADAASTETMNMSLALEQYNQGDLGGTYRADEQRWKHGLKVYG